MLPRLVRLADSLLAAAVAERVLAALEHLTARVDAGVVDASVVQQARVCGGGGGGGGALRPGEQFRMGRSPFSCTCSRSIRASIRM